MDHHEAAFCLKINGLIGFVFLLLTLGNFIAQMKFHPSSTQRSFILKCHTQELRAPWACTCLWVCVRVCVCVCVCVCLFWCACVYVSVYRYLKACIHICLCGLTTQPWKLAFQGPPTICPLPPCLRHREIVVFSFFCLNIKLWLNTQSVFFSFFGRHRQGRFALSFSSADKVLHLFKSAGVNPCGVQTDRDRQMSFEVCVYGT